MKTVLIADDDRGVGRLRRRRQQHDAPGARLEVLLGVAAGPRRAGRVELREEGVGDEDLARIRAPIGLDIGSRTPAEVAVAVAAEIVSVRRGRA